MRNLARTVNMEFFFEIYSIICPVPLYFVPFTADGGVGDLDPERLLFQADRANTNITKLHMPKDLF